MRLVNYTINALRLFYRILKSSGKKWVKCILKNKNILLGPEFILIVVTKENEQDKLRTPCQGGLGLTGLTNILMCS